ncbi:phage holin family protein [Pseudooctadecabacter jejudonensis]|uniref:Holin-X, holin superfamily III n=1 Tax=Pseudooctadecabacter jejudonensis TaxID=1391910 RepID=A0A1Y5T8L6_9RHOB|nr:phage holin family protein [Pseudooctadecabacter jejudonensis]SLN58016.1 hypothetical protein PSJ8397_03028 [Pseudooctadecabacter jejudonensis]
MLRPIKKAASRAGQKAAWGAAGVIFGLVGLGFLTAAMWMILVVIVSPLYTSAIIGLFYLGLGCISFAAAASRHPQDVPYEPQTSAAAADAPPLVEAFLYGLKAGHQAKSHRR